MAHESLSSGGAFDPWGGPGYDMCARMIGPEWANVCLCLDSSWSSIPIRVYDRYFTRRMLVSVQLRWTSTCSMEVRTGGMYNLASQESELYWGISYRNLAYPGVYTSYDYGAVCFDNTRFSRGILTNLYRPYARPGHCRQSTANWKLRASFTKHHPACYLLLFLDRVLVPHTRATVVFSLPVLEEGRTRRITTLWGKYPIS